MSNEAYCYLTTSGRKTGRPHEVEIWFALVGDTAYLMNGNSKSEAGHADWLRNLRQQPACTMRIRDVTFSAIGRLVTDTTEDALARRLLVEKYATPERPLTEWGETAVPVAIELTGTAQVT